MMAKNPCLRENKGFGCINSLFSLMRCNAACWIIARYVGLRSRVRFTLT
ncbi:hypothetical protein PSWA111526_26615 [Pseudomonas wadenswilerensis]|uniref:Uncharacterized protein n=1 Tax=Pseudomonas wadenswilerensis TaxID=1785161 RepID=A0A380T616_9PSED|nr:hypothetical protein CCOS864_05164 [Pseudomonas wadenswilerensis]